jgi:reactive chlorine resistance protein C
VSILEQPDVIIGGQAMNDRTSSFAEHEGVRVLADHVIALGRCAGLVGVVLVLLAIGGLKFTQVEIEGLKPIIEPTPWLAWMYPAFGEAGASYLLGVVELATALLLMLSPWSVRAGLVGGAIAALTFLVTTSIMFAAPIWEEASGGFPWINELGQFLIKDVALLAVSLVILGESLARRRTQIAGQSAQRLPEQAG